MQNKKWMWRAGGLVGVVVMLAGCVTPGQRGRTAEDEEPEVPVKPTRPERPPAGPGASRALPPVPTRQTEPAPAAPPIGRPRGAMVAKPLDVVFRCAALDERHYSVQADVEVKQSQVKYLRMRLVTPVGGTCEFDLPDFTQTRSSPLVELQARSGRCTLRMWEQGPQVTLAYSDCRQYCKPGASFEQMLPTLYDRRVNRCN